MRSVVFIRDTQDSNASVSYRNSACATKKKGYERHTETLGLPARQAPLASRACRRIDGEVRRGDCAYQVLVVGCILASSAPIDSVRGSIGQLLENKREQYER
jgi:hypothetical protein